MPRFTALAIIALLQAAFILLTLMLLGVTRFRGSRQRASIVDANIALVENNAAVAAEIAVAMSKAAKPKPKKMIA